MTGPDISDAETLERETEAAAVHAAASPPDLEPPDCVTLDNGVVLKIRKVPPLLLARAQEQIAVPKVPLFHNTERDEDEENPNHPDYIAAVEAYKTAIEMAAMNAMLLLGTSIKSVPEGIDKPEDEDWTFFLDALDVKIPEGKPGRYLAWLRYYAITTPLDLLETMNAVGRVTGVSEADVLQAVESFRSNQGRGVNTNGTAPPSPGNGDPLPAGGGGDGSGA